MTMLMCLLFLSSSSDSASHSVLLLGLLVMDIFIEPIGMTIKDLKTSFLEISESSHENYPVACKMLRFTYTTLMV